MLLAFNIDLILAFLGIVIGIGLIVGYLFGIAALINEERRKVCRNCGRYDRDLGACMFTFRNKDTEAHCDDFIRRV